MRIRCIVFDLDGTLIDSNSLKREAFFEACASVRGARAVLPDLIADAHDDRYGIIRRLLQTLEPEATHERYESLVARYSDLTEAGTAGCPEVPGASAVLVSLGRRWPLYVNSATPETSLRKAIERRGWTNRFRLVLGRPASKAENLALICRAEHCRPSEATFVGDALSDLKASREFGCHFVGYRLHPQLRAADASNISSLEELEPLLDARMASV